MSKKTRNRFSAPEKVAILRLHLLEHTPVSDLCDQHGIHPTMFYRWQKEFFEGVIAPVPGIMRLFWAFSPSTPPESPSQEDSSLANMLDTLEARCRSDGPPAGPRSIDPLPGSRSFLTVSAVA